jgi:hypothetical protein
MRAFHCLGQHHGPGSQAGPYGRRAIYHCDGEHGGTTIKLSFLSPHQITCGWGGQLENAERFLSKLIREPLA